MNDGIAQFIVPPGLGAMAGPLGALALAADAEGLGNTRPTPLATAASL